MLYMKKQLNSDDEIKGSNPTPGASFEYIANTLNIMNMEIL